LSTGAFIMEMCRIGHSDVLILSKVIL
jgi:hypothetical protein